MKFLIFIFLFDFLIFLVNSESCSTPACKDAADFIIQAIDTSVDPCSNFFEFACGNWKQHNPVTGSKSVVTVSSVLNDQISSEIRQVLESKVSDENANSVKYAAHIYNKCMYYMKEDDYVGSVLLKKVLKSILGESREWGIGRKDVSTSYSWAEDYANAQAAGVSAFLKLSIQPDLKNVTANHFILESTSFALGDDELIKADKNQPAIDAYKQLIIDSASELYSDELILEEEMLDLIKEDAEKIIKLETKLAKLKQPIENNRFPDKIYNPIKLNELKSKTQVDFKSQIFDFLFKKLKVSYPVTLINAHDVNYTIEVLKLIPTIKPRTLKIYIGWRIIQRFLSFSTENFRLVKFKFDQVTRGVKSLGPRNTTCVDFTNANINMGLSRLYSEKFFTVKEKNDAAKIIDFVQEANSEIISENAWLDSQTKKASLNKLKKIIKNVAFPNWLLNNTELDEFYSLKETKTLDRLLKNKNYLVSLVDFTNLQMKSSIENFAKPNDFTKKWPFPPAEVNAAYEPTQNSIFIPAGILKLPFFHSERPAVLNFGGVGGVVGHEFLHAFDDEGRQYDVTGNFKTWWSEKTINQFDNLTNCFIDQYNNQKEPITQLNLNGKNTLGENIADNDGLRVAYRAFLNHQKKVGSNKIEGVPYSENQLFFISYAHTWCSASTTQYLKNKILTDVHAPDVYRVNVVASNLKEFSETFKCPLGSEMNPEKKCQIW